MSNESAAVDRSNVKRKVCCGAGGESMVPGSLPIFQPLMCPATMIPAGTTWRSAPVPTEDLDPDDVGVVRVEGPIVGVADRNQRRGGVGGNVRVEIDQFAGRRPGAQPNGKLVHRLRVLTQQFAAGMNQNVDGHAVLQTYRIGVTE